MLAVNRDIVQRLEGLLAQARDGKLRALLVVSVLPGGFVHSGWDISDDASMHTLNSGAQLVAQRILLEMNASCIPDKET